MNTSRTTRLVLLVIAVAVGGIILYSLAKTFYDNIDRLTTTRDKLEKDLATLNARQEQLNRDKIKLDHWRNIGLPADITMANMRYSSLLETLLYKHDLMPLQTPDATASRAPGRGKQFTPLNYQWKIEGTFPHLLSFLEEFHRLNLPHAIREMNVSNPVGGAGAKLEILMKIEVLSFAANTNRDFLPALPDKTIMRLEALAALKGCPTTGLTYALAQFGPTGLYGNVSYKAPRPPLPKPGQPLPPPEQRRLLAHSKLAGDASGNRDYAQLTKKDVTSGLAEPPKETSKGIPPPDLEILKHVQLTLVSEVKDERTGFTVVKAMYWDRLQNRYSTVRAEPPLNEIVIEDANRHVLLRARAVAITEDLRKLILEVAEKYFAVHIGHSFGEDLHPDKALTAAELKTYKLPSASAKEP
jgi:hypothetical protein